MARDILWQGWQDKTLCGCDMMEYNDSFENNFFSFRPASKENLIPSEKAEKHFS